MDSSPLEGSSNRSPRTWAEFVNWTKSNNCHLLLANNVLLTDRDQLNDPTNLLEIGVNGSTISDLSPFAEATNLRSIMFNDTPVSDLSPLSSLKKLEFVVLARTKVTDLTPLMDLPNLSKVDVDQTPVRRDHIAELQRALPNCSINGTPLNR
jgi:Leucine-rich repeat (LRR) protein